MSLEHQKFKQFLKNRSIPAGTSRNSHGERALNAMKKLKARHRRGEVTVPPQECSNASRASKKRGRPAKREEEKVRLVSMKLPPDALEELRDLPFGRGVGSKVRELLAYFRCQEEKEIARAKLLRKLLVPFDAHLHNYLEIAKVNSHDSKALTLLEKLLQLSKKIQLTVEVFYWKSNDFRSYLREDEVLTLQFALDFKREVCENRSFQQIL